MSRRTKKVGILDVSKELNALFFSYGQDVNEVVDDAMMEVAKGAEQKLSSVKTFSPNGSPTGEYSKDWDILVEPVRRFTRRFVVHNVDHYQLTHLLESGHSKYLWGRKTGETVPGYSHIAPVNEWAQKEIVKEVIERITDLNTL